MSKVTVEIDFLGSKRVLDLYNGYKLASCFEYKNGPTPNSDAMEVIRSVLQNLGLTVEGIEE